MYKLKQDVTAEDMELAFSADEKAKVAFMEVRGIFRFKKGGTIHVPNESLIYRHENGFMNLIGPLLYVNGVVEAAIPLALIEPASLEPIEFEKDVITITMPRAGKLAPAAFRIEREPTKQEFAQAA